MYEFGLISLGKHTRWLMTAIYMFTASCSSSVTTTCSQSAHPSNRYLTRIILKAYGFTALDISHVVIAGLVAVFATYVPSNIIMRRLSIKWGMVAGYSIASLGAICEMFIDHNVYFFHLGYFLIKFGTLTCIVGRGPFAANWFKEKQRIVAIAMIQASIYFGYGGNGQILLLFIRNKGHLSSEEIKTGVQGYLRTLLGFIVVAILLNIFLLRSKPRANEIEEEDEAPEEVMENQNLTVQYGIYLTLGLNL